MSSENAEARTIRLPMNSAAAAIHPGWVRLTHWINVIAMFVMITSGWPICDASPLFGFVIPPYRRRAWWGSLDVMFAPPVGVTFHSLICGILFVLWRLTIRICVRFPSMRRCKVY